MIRKAVFIFVIVLSFVTGAFAADDLKGAFQEGELYGQFRTFYFVRDFDVNNTREDVASGGMLYYRTAPLYGVNIGLAFLHCTGHGIE